VKESGGLPGSSYTGVHDVLVCLFHVRTSGAWQRRQPDAAVRDPNRTIDLRIHLGVVSSQTIEE